MKLKRIMGICQAILCAAIIALLAAPCISIVPCIKEIPSIKFNGFEIYLGTASDFKTSVGGVMMVSFVGLSFIMAVLKIALPKLSLIWNLIIACLSVFVVVFFAQGAGDFMVNATTDIIERYEGFSSIGLSVGSIMGIVCAVVVAGAAVTDEIVAYIKK